MTSLAHHSSIILPWKRGPYSASGWADGFSAAPAGRPQYPALLNGYGPHRPPWNVAGVDYRVGVPEGAILTDWRTLSDPQLAVDTVNCLIEFFAGSNYVFKNIDFSLGGGAICHNQSASATTITFINCKFALPAWSPNLPGLGTFFISDQGNAKTTIMNCSFDGVNQVICPSFLNFNGSVTALYNFFTHTDQQVLGFGPIASNNNTLICKYNLYYKQTISPGSHMNYLEGGFNGIPAQYDIEFNTTFQDYIMPGPGAGEGFQFYSNSPGGTQLNPKFLNNTMIAMIRVDGTVDPTNGNVSMSNMVNGTSSGTPVVGTGQNNNNYFDYSGAFNPWYPGTMTPARNWSSSGNRNMITGAIITPT